MPDCKIVTTERRPTAVVRVKARLSELREAQQTSRARLTEVLPTLGVAPLGHTCTLWRPPVDGVLDMEAGALVSGPFAAVDDVVPSELPAGRAAYFLLRGSFEGLPDAWKTLLDWCAAHGVDAWAVWVPDEDRDSAGMLAARGHVLDASPLAMAMELADLGPELPAPEGVEPGPIVGVPTISTGCKCDSCGLNSRGNSVRFAGITHSMPRECP